MPTPTSEVPQMQSCSPAPYHLYFLPDSPSQISSTHPPSLQFQQCLPTKYKFLLLLQLFYFKGTCVCVRPEGPRALYFLLHHSVPVPEAESLPESGAWVSARLDASKYQQSSCLHPTRAEITGTGRQGGIQLVIWILGSRLWSQWYLTTEPFCQSLPSPPLWHLSVWKSFSLSSHDHLFSPKSQPTIHLKNNKQTIRWKVIKKNT